MPSVSRGMYKWLVCQSATQEDFADRLNHFWTVGLLLLLATIISWHQTQESPIHCWTPPEFTDQMSTYTSHQCWHSYFITYPTNRVSYHRVNLYPEEQQENEHAKLSATRTLYQWLPLILCFQAMLFKLPNLLMYILQSLSGISFDKIAGLTNGYENLTLQERSILCRQIGRYIYNWCQQCKNCLPWRQLTLLWLFIKFLYCVNIIAQLSLVDGLLAPERFTSFGDVIIGNVFKNNATVWKDVSAFPKRIFCELDVKNFRNSLVYLIQCNLTGNYFSQFAYMFLWVWLVFVAMVTCFSSLIWFLKTLIPIFRRRYITKALSLTDDLDLKVMPAYDIGKFCDLIGEDGVMALKLAGSNSSDLMVSEIIRNMWLFRAAVSTTGVHSRQVITAPTTGVQSRQVITAPTIGTRDPSVPSQSTIYPVFQSQQAQQMEQKF